MITLDQIQHRELFYCKKQQNDPITARVLMRRLLDSYYIPHMVVCLEVATGRTYYRDPNELVELLPSPELIFSTSIDE